MSMNISDSRPFPVRFDPASRERLDLLAQLTGRSATDIVREGTERLLDELSAKPEIRARVDDLVADIRKEADERQAAVNALFGLDTLASAATSSEPNSDEVSQPDDTDDLNEAIEGSGDDTDVDTTDDADADNQSTAAGRRPTARKAPAKKATANKTAPAAP